MTSDVQEGFYKMQYRCANCGHLFDAQVRKGSPARGASGSCPNCGMATGKPGVGHHETVLPNMTVGNKEILHG